MLVGHGSLLAEQRTHAVFEDGRRTGNHRQRVAFAHESGVRSAVVASVTDRWDVRVCDNVDRAELVSRIGLFVGDAIHRELAEGLPRPD